MGVFFKSRLTSTRQTGSPDSISTKTNSHLKPSTDSHSFQKSHLYFWAQEKRSSFDFKGSFKIGRAKYLRQGRKSMKGLINFIHLLLRTAQKSHSKCLCPLQPLIPMLGGDCLKNLGSVGHYLLSGFQINI